MNDIFKLFKKRAQSGKSTNITDVIKDLNENEKDEIGKFDRGNKSYLSISKSGRLKSKKACQNNTRILNDDLFNPNKNLPNKGYDQLSDNADSSLASSASSSFRSSYEDLNKNQSNYKTTNKTSAINYPISYKRS